MLARLCIFTFDASSFKMADFRNPAMTSVTSVCCNRCKKRGRLVLKTCEIDRNLLQRLQHTPLSPGFWRGFDFLLMTASLHSPQKAKRTRHRTDPNYQYGAGFSHGQRSFLLPSPTLPPTALDSLPLCLPVSFVCFPGTCLYVLARFLPGEGNQQDLLGVHLANRCDPERVTPTGQVDTMVLLHPCSPDLEGEQEPTLLPFHTHGVSLPRFHALTL